MSGGPETRYARSGHAHIAYHTLGDDGVDMLEVPSGLYFSIEDTFDEPHWERFERRLAKFCRLVRYDFRGIGMSDPFDPSDPPTIEERANDALAVLDDAGSPRPVVYASWAGGLPAMLLAATHPERVRALVLVHCFARWLRARDYPAGIPGDVFSTFAASLTNPKLEPVADDIALLTPALAHDTRYRRWWRRATHRAATPTVAEAYFAIVAGSDLRDVLPAITVPTLVIQRVGNQLNRVSHSRYLAEHIAGSKYVELPGSDHLPWVGDGDAIADEIEEFVTGTRPLHEPERILTTVLFTDIVGSTERAAAVGDRRWGELLTAHRELVRAELERFRGTEIDTAGDGFFATFDGPARAIRCACTIRDAIHELGIEIRAGLHTGEVELAGTALTGLTIHIGARVGAQARPGEVLVSRTVADLVVGSGIRFVDRGLQTLKGVPGDWQLLAVVST